MSQSDLTLDQMWRARSGESGTSDAIYKTLREAVLEKVLPPGERLSEEGLANELGVSRTPIREALLRLETEGLISRPSGRSVVVSSLTQDEILEIYTVRAHLDGLAAALAATHIIPPKLAELRWINSKMRDAASNSDFEKMARLNVDFHQSMAEGSGNAFLAYLMTQVHARVRRFPGTTFAQEGRGVEALDEHDAILDAIDAGDAELAEKLASEHMDHARQVRTKMVLRDEKSR